MLGRGRVRRAVVSGRDFGECVELWRVVGNVWVGGGVVGGWVGEGERRGGVGG